MARALAPHPKLLLLDEPLSALDKKLREEMQSELIRLQSQLGITFIMVTHDPRAAKKANNMKYLEKGILANAPEAGC